MYVEILKTINEVILKEQIKRIKDSKQYSIIVHGGTDVSSRGELLIQGFRECLGECLELPWCAWTRHTRQA